MWKGKFFVLGVMAVLAAALLTLGGCGSTTSDSSGAKGKSMVVGVNLFSTTLDPHKDYDGWFVVRYGLGETLARVSDKMTLEPWLATKWEMLDATTWKITLRDGVKFHTGAPMTAEAVKASLERSIASNKRGPANLAIDTMEAAGQELTIRTKEPRPDLIYELCDPYCAIVDVQAAQGADGFRNTVAGTGPFKVKSFTENISVVVTAFDDYWGGKAKLDEVEFRYLNDPDTRMMSLQSGDIDASINIDSKNLQLFEDAGKYTVSRCPSMRATYVFFNTKNRFLQDKNLRTALIMAADKKSYLKSVLGGVGGFFFNARDGLLVVFGGQDGVGNRNVVVEADTGNACAGFVGNQLEMIGFAADDDADGDQCVILVAGGHVLQHQRHFQRAGHGRQCDVIICHAQFQQFFACRFHHRAAHFIGETRLHDADFETLSIQIRSDCFHVFSFLVKIGSLKIMLAAANR